MYVLKLYVYVLKLIAILYNYTNYTLAYAESKFVRIIFKGVRSNTQAVIDANLRKFSTMRIMRLSITLPPKITPTTRTIAPFITNSMLAIHKRFMLIATNTIAKAIDGIMHTKDSSIKPIGAKDLAPAEPCGLENGFSIDDTGYIAMHEEIKPIPMVAKAIPIGERVWNRIAFTL